MPQDTLSVPTPETTHFWDGCASGELRLQWCDRCAAHFFYPRPACPTCGLDDRLSWRLASGRATLHSYIVSHLPAPGFAPGVPFVIAVVELAEGPRMMTNIVGVDPEPEQLELDMPLLVEFAERDGQVVPVYRPDGSGATG